MTTIGLISDTHHFLSPKINEHLHDVDEIWHVGDIGNEEISIQLKSFKPLRAVYGNIDGMDIRKEFPEFLFFEVEKMKVLMIHIGGYPPKYNIQSKKLLDIYKPDLFITGHSHILKIVPHNEKNLLHINPGACGKEGWHKTSTIIKLKIEGAKIIDLKVIEWEKGL